MKRVLSVLVIVAMMVCSFTPREAQAATATYYEVIADGTTIHAKARESSRVITSCQAGAVLEVKGSCRNIFFNKWYKLEYNGETCYIYSKDVKKHNHSYMDLTFNGVTYMICDCGSVTFWAESYEDQVAGEKVNMAVTMALPLSLAAVDGPLPVGDLLAAGILILAGCMSMDVTMPTTEELAVLMSEAEFERYLESRNENACSMESFRRVKIVNDKLHFVDDKCLDIVEAYIYVRFLKKDVWTPNENSALMLAYMHGSATMERDKDEDTYFFHYHLGVRDVTKRLKGHIFFGTNDYGEIPY